MKILVCGGRTFSNTELMDAGLNPYRESVSLLITGAQRSRHLGSLHGWVGADFLAMEWAYRNEISFVGVPAKWSQNQKTAGTIRNVLMLEIWRPDLVIAFPGGSGTTHMIAIAEDAGVRVETPGW